RVDTINGKAADEVAEGTHFDDLPAAFPTQRFALNSDDATLKAIEWLTPLGRGSRAVIAGGPRAGKSEALRRIAAALAAQEDLDAPLPGARPRGERDAAPGAAGRRGGGGRDRPGAGAGARRQLARDIGHAPPRGLGGELDRLAAALGLHVGEGLRVRVEGDVELAFLDALVQPRGAQDQATQPVHERAVRRADELGPAVVDVLAQRRARVGDLAVDREIDEILQLGVAEAPADEGELHRRLLAALGEVSLVEGEAQLAVLEHEVVAGVVVAALSGLHWAGGIANAGGLCGSGVRGVGIVCPSPSLRLPLQHKLQWIRVVACSRGRPWHDDRPEPVRRR